VVPFQTFAIQSGNYIRNLCSVVHPAWEFFEPVYQALWLNWVFPNSNRVNFSPEISANLQSTLKQAIGQLRVFNLEHPFKFIIQRNVKYTFMVKFPLVVQPNEAPGIPRDLRNINTGSLVPRPRGGPLVHIRKVYTIIELVSLKNQRNLAIVFYFTLEQSLYHISPALVIRGQVYPTEQAETTVEPFDFSFGIDFKFPQTHIWISERIFPRTWGVVQVLFIENVGRTVLDSFYSRHPESRIAIDYVYEVVRALVEAEIICWHPGFEF
jgi:hypothetical protein